MLFLLLLQFMTQPHLCLGHEWPGKNGLIDLQIQEAINVPIAKLVAAHKKAMLLGRRRLAQAG
jgi:hypothetical protein